MKIVKSLFKVVSISTSAFLLLFMLSACEQGPAEKAGEKIDNAAESVGDAAEDAVDEVEDVVD